MSDNVKSNSILLKSIEDAKGIISSDINRLRTIVDAINTGDAHIDINDRLISNLNNIEFGNRDVEIAIEYLTLILSNIESQKINYNKQVSEELIGVLRHTLAAVKSLENCALDVIGHIDGCKESDIPNMLAGVKEDNKDKPALGLSGKELLLSLLPNNKVSNGIFWIVILFTAFGMTYALNPDTITAFNAAASESAEAIKKIK